MLRMRSRRQSAWIRRLKAASGDVPLLAGSRLRAISLRADAWGGVAWL